MTNPQPRYNLARRLKSLKLQSKIVGLCVLLVSCGLFLNQAIICIGRFVSKETQINLEVLSSSTATFPHLTICPDYHDAYKGDILQQYNTSAGQIRKYKFPKVPNMTTYEFYDLITLELSEVVDTIKVKVTNAINMHNKHIFTVTYTQNPTAPEQWYNDIASLPLNQEDWTTQRYKTFGRCYTFNIPKLILQATITKIYLVAKKPSVVYMHHPGQFLIAGITDQTKLSLQLGKQFFMETRHEITVDYSKALTKEQKIEQNSVHNSTCDNESDFGRDKCLIDALDRRSIDAFGCTFPTMTNQKEKSCDAKQSNESGFMEKFERKLFSDRNCSIIHLSYFSYPELCCLKRLSSAMHQYDHYVWIPYLR